MRFIVESADDFDYSTRLEEAGVKVGTESLDMEYPIEGMSVRTCTTRMIADLDSLEDLMKVKEAVGYDIIIGRENSFDEYPKITVHDGWVE